jgi:glycosyltransferase involved in cell wall biosynthesis
MQPIVSVICAFFNAGGFIGEAVDSVLSQDFDDFELLLVDDGSTDSSSRFAAEMAEQFPAKVRYLTHPGRANRGASPSRNLGLQQARGKFVALIDADDRWRPGKLREQVAILDRNDEVVMVCGTVNYWKSWSGGRDRLVTTGNLKDRISRPPETTFSLYPLGRAHAPCPSDVLLRRSTAEQLGGFEEEFVGPLQLYEDQAFFTKLYLTASVYFSSKVWSDHRQHDESCVATVRRNGLYREVRQYFLDWLSGYVDAHNPADGDRIRRAIERARWDLDHPTMSRLLWRGRRLASVVRALSRVRNAPGFGGGEFVPTDPLPAAPDPERRIAPRAARGS